MTSEHKLFIGLVGIIAFLVFETVLLASKDTSGACVRMCQGNIKSFDGPTNHCECK